MRFKLPIMLLTALFTSICAGADIPGDELLKYFGASCKSQGEWTKAALSDSRALMAVLENLADDPDCISISGALSSLNNLQSTIHELENGNRTKVQIEKLKAQEIALMDQLAATEDEFVKRDLQLAINSVQVQKASLMAEDSTKEDLQGEDIKNIYSKIVSSSEQVFNTLTANQKCLNKNPGLLSSATSLTSSLASSALHLNPAVSIGLAASTDFIGTAVESFRKGFFNRRVRNLSQNTIALEGYMCALESLTDRWCELRDAENFINFKARLRRQTNRQSGLKSAVRLNDRDLPVLLDWLNKVRAGVPASTTADGERQKRVFEREAAVRSADAIGNGVIGENKPLFDSLTNPKDKYSVLKSVISSLTGMCGSDAGSGEKPLQDIYTGNYAPYYLLGLDKIPTQGDFNIYFCDFDPFAQWPNGAYSPDFDLMKNRYKEWIERARKRVNQELTLVLQPDALQALTSAYERTGSKWKISTIDALKNIKEFLESYSPETFASYAYTKIYQDTILDLAQIIEVVETNVLGEIAAPKTALEKIYDAADLQYGTIVIQTRLEMAIRVSLDAYFKKAGQEENNIASQLLAADSYLEVLEKISGTDNLGAIKADVKRGQRITLGNMETFANVFAGNINKILKKNVKKASGYDQLISGVYERNVAEVCVLLSSLPKWPSKVDRSLCENVYIPEVIPGGPKSVTVNSTYIASPYSVRECGYRDYMRKSKIFQDWGVIFENEEDSIY